MVEEAAIETSRLLNHQSSSYTLTSNSNGDLDPLDLEKFKTSDSYLAHLKKIKKLGLLDFYESQNELIEELLSTNLPAAPEDTSAQLFKLKVAIYGSVFANVLLFLLQLYAAVTTGSLSLFATMADAFMDLLSSVILLLAGKAAERSNHFKYPTIEGVTALFSERHEVALDAISIGCVVLALVTKIFLYFYCIALSKYPSANILALDHRNDIIVNVFGLSMFLLADKLYPWIDPIGCLLVALIILKSWVSTALEHIDLIVGKSADVNFLKKLTYLAMTHDSRIVQIDTCRAYHVGNNVFVEVDIVLDPTTPLRQSHDIGETLQIKLERIPEVERAFVHVDYESFHKPEHRSHIGE